ncbi:MAG: hypothetical protein ACYDHE_02445 [Candidatus Acidiferrales bacterium]
MRPEPRNRGQQWDFYPMKWMSTNPSSGVADLAVGTPTEPEIPIDWDEWEEVDPADWPATWPDSVLVIEQCPS